MSTCAGFRCRGPDGKPRESQATTCAQCEHRVAAALTEVPLLFVGLYGALGSRRAPDVSVTKVSYDGSEPIRLDIDAAMDLLLEIMLDWESTVRVERHLSAGLPVSGRGHALTRAVHTLSAHYSVLTASPHHARPFSHDLLSTVWHAEALLGWDALTHRLPAPCPNCNLLTLVRHDGDDAVYCRNCHARWDEAEYRRLVYVLASESRGG